MDFLALLVATGLVSGATYGLIAMGFALIYKSTGWSISPRANWSC